MLLRLIHHEDRTPGQVIMLLPFFCFISGVFMIFSVDVREVCPRLSHRCASSPPSMVPIVVVSHPLELITSEGDGGQRLPSLLSVLCYFMSIKPDTSICRS